MRALAVAAVAMMLVVAPVVAAEHQPVLRNVYIKDITDVSAVIISKWDRPVKVRATYGPGNLSQKSEWSPAKDRVLRPLRNLSPDTDYKVVLIAWDQEGRSKTKTEPIGFHTLPMLISVPEVSRKPSEPPGQAKKDLPTPEPTPEPPPPTPPPPEPTPEPLPPTEPPFDTPPPVEEPSPPPAEVSPSPEPVIITPGPTPEPTPEPTPPVILPTFSDIHAEDQLEHQVTIVWDTDIPTEGRVEWGLDTSYGNLTDWDAPSTHHAVTLTGLEPDTKYHYRVWARIP